jgi:hypothetical protein
LTDEEATALLRELNDTIENDRCPVSPRSRGVRGIREIRYRVTAVIAGSVADTGGASFQTARLRRESSFAPAESARHGGRLWGCFGAQQFVTPVFSPGM